MKRDKDENHSSQRIQQSSPTGRSAQFYAPVGDEQDVEAIGQRVAQFVAIGLQRGELDAVKVSIQEASMESGSSGGSRDE